MPNGCGSYFAKVYFLSFQVLVSQVFINLFIAIIVDSFVAQSDSFVLPVKKNDVEEFVKDWKEFDPSARGWIPADKFEDLIVAIASN